MKGLFVKAPGALKAADEAAVRILARIPIGTMVNIDASVPKDQRSVQQNRLYFALLNKVFENLPEKWAAEIPTVEHLRMRIAYAIGWTECVMTGAGPKEIPKSMSFDKCPQSEFVAKVWDPTIRVIMEKLIPGIDRAELETAVNDMLAVRA